MSSSSSSKKKKKENHHYRQPQSQQSAILANGRVNISLLECEIHTELTDDARHVAEDLMKKRAIHTSKDYDEFEKFVSVSQLKPVNGSELKQLFTTTVGVGSGGGVIGSDDSMSSHRLANKAYQKNNTTSDWFGVSSNVGCGIRTTHNSGGGNHSAKECVTRNGKGKTMDTYTMTTMMMTKKTKKKTRRPHLTKNVIELSSQWKKWCKSPSLALKFLLLPIGACLEEEMTIRNHSGEEEEWNIMDFTRIQTNDNDSSLPSPPPSPALDSVHFCLRLQPEDVVPLCKVEMEASLMEGIFEALHLAISMLKNTTLEEEDDEKANADVFTFALMNFVYRWMHSMTKCGRFSLNMDFLSASQKDRIRGMVEYLERQIEVSSPTCSSDSRGVMYDKKDLLMLREAYNR